MPQPVHKAYRKCCVKFRTTPSVRTGFPAVIQHLLSEHLSKIKNLKRSNFGQSVFLRAQNALCGKTGEAVIGLRVSEQDGMFFSSFPTRLSLVRVNQPIPTQFWCRNQKDTREKNIEPEIYRDVKVTNNGWCVLDHDLSSAYGCHVTE
jgi:hypothetical protein